MFSKRIIITLPEQDRTWLESYSKAYDISIAEAIRQGIKRLRRTTMDDTYCRIVDKTKGIWKKGDGLEYQQIVRSEWQR